MKNYLAKIDIGLDSKIVKTVPKVLIKIDDEQLYDLDIKQSRSIPIEKHLSQGKHILEIIFYNKNYKESGPDGDMAVLIKHIKFQQIDKDLHYLSKYFPEYPKNFLQEQKQSGKEWSQSILSNYLGWNGRYVMQFETPIYAWIHQKLNLGWLIK